MPFIQFKQGFVRLYHDPRLSPGERDQILENLRCTPDLLVGVRFYENEKCFLKYYYEKVVGTEKITAFREYPASVLTETIPGDKTSRVKQPCIILVAVTGPNHLNELTDEGDIGIVGCYPLSVQPYHRGDHVKKKFNLASALVYRETPDYKAEGYLRDFIASNPLEFQYTMIGIKPFEKEVPFMEVPIIELGDINGAITSIEEFTTRLEFVFRKFYLQGEDSENLKARFNPSKFPTFTEISEVAQREGLNLDGNSIFRLINIAANGYY